MELNVTHRLWTWGRGLAALIGVGVVVGVAGGTGSVWARSQPGIGSGSTAGSTASAGGDQPPWHMAEYEAVSRPSDVRELAFGIRGRIAELLVAPGQLVSAGDEIIRMDDQVQRSTVALAELQAGSRTALETAEATVAFYTNDLTNVREALASGASSDRELWEGEYRLRVAELEIATAHRELEEAAIVLQRERDRLAEMTVHSPIDGVVVDVHKRGGEAVDEQATVVTVIQIDPLWIDVNMSTRDALRLRRGQKAQITWQDIDRGQGMSGQVIFISPAGHAGARQIMVRLEVANPEGLPAGLHATVQFMPPQTDGADAGAMRLPGFQPSHVPTTRPATDRLGRESGAASG